MDRLDVLIRRLLNTPEGRMEHFMSDPEFNQAYEEFIDHNCAGMCDCDKCLAYKLEIINRKDNK